MKKKLNGNNVAILKVGILLIVLFLTTVSCVNTHKHDENCNKNSIKTECIITEQEVLDVQKIWSDGIVSIGKVYTEGGDYVTAAKQHIENLYGYNLGSVLFKPTLVSEKQIRTDMEGALSYFVAGNPNYPEDHGFAIKPWTAIRWESAGVKISGNMAVAMGNYYFTPANNGDEVKVEYSFAYIKDVDGKLRIVLHDSHLPYKPTEKH
jgi:hypothetical protein